jgi:hypothetical protein
MGETHPPLGAHLAKHAGMLARLTLGFHALMVDVHPAEIVVELETVQRADRVLRGLLGHAAAMFDVLGGGATAFDLARQLALSILASELKTPGKNDFLQACRAFRKAEPAEQWAAIELLQDMQWLFPLMTERQYAARPTGWAVNPAVHTTFAAQAAAHRARRREVVAAIRGDE